jgi:hypothetical protein
MTSRTAWIALGGILAVSASLIFTAMLRTSTTFDEIVFVAGGVRGFEIGEFDLVPDHPPLMQYIYGLPVWLDGPQLPDESLVPDDLLANPAYRYRYAASLYWASGNDPERIALLSRIPAVLMTLALILVTFLFTRRHWGPAAALLAATLVAFLPDVLGHGGVAYSDVPVTLAFLAGLWAIDKALRSMSLLHGAIAGAVAALAVAVKISAAALLPAAVLIAGAEALKLRYGSSTAGYAAWPDRAWFGRLMLLGIVATATAYLVMVLVYRGDFSLEQFRWGLAFRYSHITGGHEVGAILLQQESMKGWWYFFPVAFLFKTSAGLHVLAGVAAVTLAVRVHRRPMAILTSGLRAPLAGLLVFGVALLNSNLNIGFRYALPVLPLICIMTAVGVTCAWRTGTRLVRGALVAALSWAVLFPISFHPHYLGFISEYGPGRERAYEVLVDSSLDWGQGLLELRDFMRDNEIPVVYLSYFGSAFPAGYGIEYVPLGSYFPLPRRPQPAQLPEWIAISATNLRGGYFESDPFAQFRAAKPDAVLARSIYLYHLGSLESP